VLSDLVPKLQIREAGIVNIPPLVVDPKTGEQLTSWDLSQHMEERYGQSMIHILWQGLLNILLKALDHDCKHMGYECLDVLQVKSFPCFLLFSSFRAQMPHNGILSKYVFDVCFLSGT
jgi:hypothetical protein